MSSATARALPTSSHETKWTIVGGAMAGTVRLMTETHFTIGRSPDCQFVIVNDPKCSRRHANVDCDADGCEITSLNPENMVAVNGSPMQKARLQDGDVVTIGSTQIQFNTTSLPDESSARRLSVVTPEPSATPQTHYRPPQTYAPPMPATYGAPYPQQYRARSRSSRRPAPSSGSKRLYLYSGLALLFLMIYLGGGAKKKDTLKIRTEQQIQADIAAANKLQESAMNDNAHRFDRSVTSREAQENFVRGFRDYRKGQFERALGSFQTCLALEPTHVLCNHYVRLAQRRFEELIQYNMVLGRQYRDQNQFRACRSAFGNAMAMIKDVSSITYREAKANYDACNAMEEGRF